jgi:hypothetical protein
MIIDTTHCQSGWRLTPPGVSAQSSKYTCQSINQSQNKKTKKKSSRMTCRPLLFMFRGRKLRSTAKFNLLNSHKAPRIHHYPQISHILLHLNPRPPKKYYNELPTRNTHTHIIHLVFAYSI